MVIEGALGDVPLLSEPCDGLPMPETVLEERSSRGVLISQGLQSLLQRATQGGGPSQRRIGPAIAPASVLDLS
jgi:hypothetical protein